MIDGTRDYSNEWQRPGFTRSPEGTNQNLVIRSEHDREFMYFLLEDRSDKTNDGADDRGIICLDNPPRETPSPGDEDICIFVTKTGVITAVKGSDDGSANNFVEVPTELKARGGMTDGFTTYEFKIPIDFVGRYSEYGFLTASVDISSQTMTMFPDRGYSDNIPPQNLWATMQSLDKTIPEFPYPILVGSIGLTLVITYVRRSRLV
jgi:hypothetical protein